MILIYEDHKRLTLDPKLQIGWKWKCRKILHAKSCQKRAEEAISLSDLMKDMNSQRHPEEYIKTKVHLDMSSRHCWSPKENLKSN